MKLKQYRNYILVLVTAVMITGLLIKEPVAQDQHYHCFADCRHIGGVDNFWNVLTNLPFLIFGVYGLIRFFRSDLKDNNKSAYFCLCAGVILTSFGSGFYHFIPDNFSLMFDRIPMTIIFMSLLSLVISSSLHEKTGRLLLLPLLSLGISSVVYWYGSELHGMGDLRLYAFVQFYPLVIVPLMLWLYPSQTISGKYLLAATIIYVIAKFCEYSDYGILNLTGFISGHSLKHLFASMAVWMVIKAVMTRQRPESAA
jgi:hypothetical protein